ncbi:MAG: homoserine kinase [Vicinamibacteria bacterium]|nr:homoserine kinase [Vicinamibacteria bacterium]
MSTPTFATAFAPATLSNLGPGFDCLGLAVTVGGDRVTVRRAAAPGVRVLSVSDPRIPLDPERNTAALAAASVLRRTGQNIGLELSVEKGLPLSAGLGGSAASAVAGAVAANAVLGATLSRREIVLAALDAEAVVSGRHPDNVAPAVWGGAVLVLSLDPLRLVTVRVAEKLRFVVATPDYAVETQQARAALPEAVRREDAVAQAAGLGALVLALERGDTKTLAAALEDRIALPYRAPLYPGFVEARDAALEAGAIGATISGGGPTVVALVSVDSDAGTRVADALRAAYTNAGYAASVTVARVDARGAHVL